MVYYCRIFGTNFGSFNPHNFIGQKQGRLHKNGSVNGSFSNGNAPGVYR
jgi:hypothetical protein